jgi:hypothetical protein
LAVFGNFVPVYTKVGTTHAFGRDCYYITLAVGARAPDRSSATDRLVKVYRISGGARCRSPTRFTISSLPLAMFTCANAVRIVQVQFSMTKVCTHIQSAAHTPAQWHPGGIVCIDGEGTPLKKLKPRSQILEEAHLASIHQDCMCTSKHGS